MNNQIESRHPIPPAPIHPLAALVTIVLDNVFGVFEILDPLMIVLTSFTVGVLGTVSTMLVQHYLAKDEWGPSIAKGLVMGIIAGVPFPVTGTAVGVPLLAWSGLHKWVKLPPITGQVASTDPDIIDAEFKDID
ncbi:MAG TPA: hypothetical protein VKF38_10740 [Anaerolineaceae bacterium]|nr:hypothetical protein [Anaerolineaceae bacterium]